MGGNCESQRSASTSALKQTAAVAPGSAQCFDHQGSHCVKCSTRFTIMKRRHHCRGCGACVCYYCRPYKIHLTNPIVGPGESKCTGAHRVCQHCYTSRSAGCKDA